ncbi:hypothetical protein [Streptomyces sp. McG3]|uniref:hypothetical protein n=1 Tax=Streptomyces sp. McG3 TaxID=2725483 RepID=UPI001BE8AD21|nr:hypothetical protein [Streptomyces sp. McG3]MBT2899934.1 hypothetical protein [Streptomyces sp. McG3]
MAGVSGAPCQGIDVAPPVVADGVDVGGGRVVLAVVPAPVFVRVRVVLVLVGAPPGPEDRPSAPEVSAPPGNVELGVGGRDGDCVGSRSDGKGDG